jgi:Tfp pilus assembly protein PilN
MIKINLLKNTGKAADQGDGKTVTKTLFSFNSGGGGGGEGGGGNGSVGALIKLLLVLALPAGLYFYEQENLQGLQKNNKKVNDELSALDAELGGLAKVNEIVQQHIADRDRIQAEVNQFNAIAALRLREMLAIDELQSIVPREVWISRLVIENARFSISAASTDSEAISVFVRSLDVSPRFSDVLLSSTTDDESKKTTIKRFELGGSVETL